MQFVFLVGKDENESFLGAVKSVILTDSSTQFVVA
jgi:hypothetical protein